MEFFTKAIRNIQNIKEPYRSLSFFLALLLVQYGFLPVGTFIVILMAYVFQSYLHTILILLAATLVSASSTFWIARLCLDKYFNTLYEDHSLLLVAKCSIQENPWSVNIMIRLLYIPVTFKNILLAISGAKFWMYLLCLVLDCLAFGSLFTLIGIRLTTFDASTKKKTFAQMSLVEKFNLILTYLLILLTIFTVATIAVYTKFKLE